MEAEAAIVLAVSSPYCNQKSNRNMLMLPQPLRNA